MLSNLKWKTSDHGSVPTGVKIIDGMPIGKQIGVVKIKQPLEHVRNSYETAAWWMSLVTDTGEYPVYLVRGDLYPYVLSAKAMIPATVKEGFFPSLWCGNMIGNGPYVDKDKGRREEIGIFTPFADACLMHGDKSDSVECIMDLDIFQDAIDYHKRELVKAYESMPKWYAEWEAGEDKFFSRVGMVAHFGEQIAKHGRYVAELERKREYFRR